MRCVVKKILWLLAMTFDVWGSDFPVPYNSEPDKSAPMPAFEAAATMKLPPGFNAAVFASEPDVQNPIAMAWDGRGRLWVAENYTYAERSLKFDLNLRDRLLIFEGQEGKNHFYSRKVFTDEVQMLTSVAVGCGGVWLMCPPRLLFVPDRNADDVPDGAPEVVLDGFTVPSENYHGFANGLRFGPDGWLYGRCGASSPGEIGKPGMPAAERIPLRGTIWRYHPKRKIFEALSSGTTNPWGHDWDANGELFFINTVNGHLWHAFPGAHFVRPHTIDPNPHAYALIDQHADHWHFNTAQGWAKSRDGNSGELGGGHAHVGMMIYLGDNWPDEYRGDLFTINFHGRRANREILERTGSGYTGHHGKDFMLLADPWFRGMDLSYGPDGGVFVADWSDTGECHESTGVHRTSGRIYKITCGEPKSSWTGDLAKLAPSELANLQLHRNEWFARQARLELANRFSEDSPDRTLVAGQLHRMFDDQNDPVIKLRMLWSLYVIGAADWQFLEKQLAAENEHIRAWAIRLLTDFWPLDTVLSQRPAVSGRDSSGSFSSSLLGHLVRIGKTDPSGLVRLVLASTLQRLPISERAPLAAALMGRTEDAADHNLPLLIWYGLIPLGDADPVSLAHLAVGCELPMTLKLIARRLAEEIDQSPFPLNELLELTLTKPEPFKNQLIEGMTEALTGYRKTSKPPAWEAFVQQIISSHNEVLHDRVRNLGVLFGDGRALEDVRKVAFDPNAELSFRKSALQALIDSKPPDLRESCERLLNVQFLNSVAARGLAAFDDPAVGSELVRAYRQFHPTERPQLLSSLVSRASFANALLDALADGRIPRSDLSTFHARQIQSLNKPALNQKLAEAWGELRENPEESRLRISKWKAQLTLDSLAEADLSQGRDLFTLTCAPCHTLYGQGGGIGPDLTGAGRDNLDYLLENIVDPSAVVSVDFRMSVLKFKDGRVLNGLITAKNDRTITLKTMTETVTVDRTDLEAIETSSASLMPDGLLEALNATQARDLIGYLMHQTQVPSSANTKATNQKAAR